MEKIATFRGRGALVAAIVAPGKEPSSELVYASYLYHGANLELISIDPSSGAVVTYPIPVQGETGARSVAVGPDGKVYFGTLPNAHLLQLDTHTGEVRDLGRPSPSEEYIWDLAFGKDGRLYGGTYPGARLIRLDPSSGKTSDLGRMDEQEMYAHYVAAGDDEFVYVGIGTRRMDIIAFNTATGEHRSILPSEFREPGQARVVTASDGKPYGLVGEKRLRLSGWTATPVERMPPFVARLHTRRGKVISLDGEELKTSEPDGALISRIAFSHPGRPIRIFSLGLGPDGHVYGSSALPAWVFRWDEGRRELEIVGDVGAGEVYSFHAHGSDLLMAGYACSAPLLRYDPGRPVRPDGHHANPTKVSFAGADSNWRPTAMVEGPGGRIYVGATGPYGKLDGQLIGWDTDTDKVTAIAALPASSGAYALAHAGDLLIVGTTILGGGGTVPTRSEASLLAWEAKTGAVKWSIVPVKGAATIEALLSLGDGRVLGLASGKAFVVETNTGQVEAVRSLPLQGPAVYGALEKDSWGRVWGLVQGTGGGIFALDARTIEPVQVVKVPSPISAGMALRGGNLYFAAGPDLFRYQLPTSSIR
ncbi:MAG: hypothetical protein NDI82_00475 [Anaeromyxobacteraceae bacterium]|nr:hypothetical protein [Anaeromyxobacteraceae bacterium]